MESKLDQLSAPDSTMKLVDNLNKAQLSNLLEELPPNDQGSTQSETFFDLEKASDDTLNIDTTNFWEAPIIDELRDSELISIIGQHLNFTITSTPQGRFVYWKGMEPPELLGHDTRLVAYVPNLPY